jgi:hypothetical protein
MDRFQAISECSAGNEMQLAGGNLRCYMIRINGKEVSHAGLIAPIEK